MRFTPQKGILVDKPFTVWFFFERDCPICAFVRRHVLRPMKYQGMIQLEAYEIRSNITSPAVKWFYDHSNYEMAGDILTPAIRIVDIYYRGEQHRIDSVKICQVPEFTLRAMEEYNESIRVDKFAKNIAVDENSPRDGFIQIALRHLLDNDIFDPTSNVVSYVLGLSRSVALGEEKYFVDKLLETEGVEVIHHKEEEITPPKVVENNHL